jgi:excisionase family DNA binding protein
VAQTKGLTIRLDDYVDVPEACKLLGVTRQAVSIAFQKGRIAGVQVGRTILLNKNSLEEYRVTRHVGRPKKTKLSTKNT